MASLKKGNLEESKEKREMKIVGWGRVGQLCGCVQGIEGGVCKKESEGKVHSVWRRGKTKTKGLI